MDSFTGLHNIVNATWYCHLTRWHSSLAKKQAPKHTTCLYIGMQYTTIVKIYTLKCCYHIWMLKGHAIIIFLQLFKDHNFCHNLHQSSFLLFLSIGDHQVEYKLDHYPIALQAIKELLFRNYWSIHIEHPIPIWMTFMCLSSI